MWFGGEEEAKGKLKAYSKKSKALAWLGETEDDGVYYSRMGLSLHQHLHFVIDFSRVQWKTAAH